MKKRRSIIRKHENAVRGESRINLYDSHFEQAFGERVICVMYDRYDIACMYQMPFSKRPE